MRHRSNLEELLVFLEKIREIHVPDAEEEIKLIEMVKNGDNDAKKKLCEAYLGLVVLIARRYAVTETHLWDLIQEGTISLMKAIEKCGDTKHFKSYATCFIKLHMMLYVEKEKIHFDCTI